VRDSHRRSDRHRWHLAGRKLLERLGAVVVEGAAIVDLPELGGSKLLRDSRLELFTVVDFSGH
jgi:adenine phosphoribosyltransferase